MRVGARSGHHAMPYVPALVRAVAAVAALACCPAAAAGSESPKLVVVLYPHESDGAPGIILVNRAIRSTFAGQPLERIEVRNEYVDTTRVGDADFMRAQVSLLQRKYAGRKPDLVIAGLSAGLDFALVIRDAVFPAVPVVFVLVDEREVKARRLPPDVTGVPTRMDLTGTLDLALRLHPATRRVFVIAGCSPFDSKWEAEARHAFRAYEDRLEFAYLTGVPMDDLLGRVAALPGQSIIYYLHIFRDSTGKGFVPAEALGRLAERANAPIYSHVDTFVERGALGGRVYAHETEGRVAARLALRILAGEKPGTIPVSGVSGNEYLFDWRQLRRWGVSEQSLPPGSVVRFKESSFWDAYRWHVIGGVSLCAAETLLIAGLLVQRVMRRRAEERFRQVVETSPTGMLLVGREGTIVMANPRAGRLFGYGKDELLGQPAEVLAPERSRRQQCRDRDRFFAAPEVRPMGSGQELFGRRKDGSEFPIEVGLSPLRTAGGLFALVSVTDLTARRQAEDGLRASRRELQLLTGRLLETQEVERRRVARELHDDINQTLALLAVEMDLLCQAPPELASRTPERVRELSARVKALSSSVHDLSHQLHPSKLGHLGLVAAVRGLGKELARHHGLEVQVTHSGVPEVIPEDTALCLYRIVQEALRNVVKHSGTSHARVELSGTPDGIRLRVSDDGAGFDPASARGGLGLVSMRERLHLVGGEIALDSRPAGGTRITVHVPVPPADRSDDLLSAEAARG